MIFQNNVYRKLVPKDKRKELHNTPTTNILGSKLSKRVDPGLKINILLSVSSEDNPFELLFESRGAMLRALLVGFRFLNELS